MRIICGWRGKREETQLRNSETTPSDRIMERGGEKGEKNIFHCHQAHRRFPNAVELGHVVWESTHIQKKVRTNVVGKVLVFFY